MATAAREAELAKATKAELVELVLHYEDRDVDRREELRKLDRRIKELTEENHGSEMERKQADKRLRLIRWTIEVYTAVKFPMYDLNIQYGGGKPELYSGQGVSPDTPPEEFLYIQIVYRNAEGRSFR